MNMDKLGEQCQLSIAKQAAFINVPDGKGVVLSPDIQTIFEQAKKTAIAENQTSMSTVHLLLGLMAPKLQSGSILREQGATPEQVKTLRGSLETLPTEAAVVPLKPVEKATPVKRAYRFQISLVFLTLVGITVLAGISAYNEWASPAISVFLFVTGGWVVSLCLHEFGHAIVAYWAGDDTVIDKGYLTLNPLKYTHGVLSIVFPILIVMMGGIGLPGGAVYINRGLIRHRYQHSLVSAAGPLATGIFALLLAIPFLLGIRTGEHFTFWAGMAMLAFLQITALFFNLLPLPGLDGFGILAPYLPEEFLRIAYSFGQFSYILIFILFFYNDNCFGPTRNKFYNIYFLF